MAVSAARGRLRSFFSTSFDQPLGAAIGSDGVRGYYIDLRVKAAAPGWPPPGYLTHEDLLWVVIAQWGLAAFEHWVESGREEWLAGARGACEHLADAQRGPGPLEGGWVHEGAHHTYRFNPPWISAMAQGQAARQLVRVIAETREERLAEAALRALKPFEVASSEGGVRVSLDAGPFFEEYPTSPPSLVLNGGIYALWGLHDVGLALDDAGAQSLFAAGLDALAGNIERWDLGYWSRYDLYPHRRVNVASLAYHKLHTDQLRAMQLIAPRDALERAADRFARYTASRRCRARAFAGKVAFRLAVPR
jgi:heparosan-N-sulfate-glucuronate 5-epimerase